MAPGCNRTGVTRMMVLYREIELTGGSAAGKIERSAEALLALTDLYIPPHVQTNILSQACTRGYTANCVACALPVSTVSTGGR
jgi:hypothetical protein